MNELLQMGRDKALRVLRRRSMSPDLAQDQAQEFSIRLWRALLRLREPRGFWRLFWQVLEGVVVDGYRRRAVRLPTCSLEQDTESTPSSDGGVRVDDQWVDRQWLLMQLPHAMDSLRASTRSLLQQQMAGSAIRDLARGCEVSEAAVKTRLHRGRQRLRFLLTERLRRDHDRRSVDPTLET